MKKYITNSPAETEQLAEELVKNLKGGEILGLVGELGSGKTVFVQGLAEALGIKEIVNSPTFVLMKVYKIPISKPALLAPRSGVGPGLQKNFKSQIPNLKYLIHVDAYRLNSFDQLKEIGAEEYFNRKDCLVVIEWADKVPALRDYPNYQEINFKEGKSSEERIIEIFK